MRSFGFWLIPLAVALIALAALSRPASGGTAVGLEIGGGYGAFDYGAVNDQLTAMNEQLGTEFGTLHGGGGMELGLRVWPTERWMLRLTFDTFTTESHSASTGEMTFDPMPGFYTLDITYFFLDSKPFRIGLGAGGGIAEVAGEFKVPGPGGKYDITGDGPEAHGLLEADIGFTKRAGVMLQGGYRYAKVPDTQFDDVSNDPVLESNLSGAYFRVGFTYDWR